MLYCNNVFRVESVLPTVSKEKCLSKGILVAIEGIDGAGKTTQAKLLVEKLESKGYPVISLHEPTNSVWGQKIRELARSNRDKMSAEEELNLFVQDRIEDVEKNINPALEANKVVVMDRYYFSSIAYQGARGLDLEDIEQRNKKIAPVPDLLIILDVKPSVSLQRIHNNRADGPNEFEKDIHLEKSRKIFNQFANREYTRIIDGDGIRSPLNISEDIWCAVETVLLCQKSNNENKNTQKSYNRN
jgi:dTMP kinase